MKGAVSKNRRTGETDVEVRLRLDGTGRANVAITDKFLKHMLESLARFSGFDLDIRAKGDLLHHEDEDIAITLGRAFREALKNRPVRRMGSATVAMDDALVNVTVDLVDRPYYDSTLPDPMMQHFLRSFALEARITLHNVVWKGREPHHIHEATFKALGLALREAVESGGGPTPSTKGPVRWK